MRAAPQSNARADNADRRDDYARAHRDYQRELRDYRAALRAYEMRNRPRPRPLNRPGESNRRPSAPPPPPPPADYGRAPVQPYSDQERFDPWHGYNSGRGNGYR
jgi:hypothetical protein